VKSTVKFSREIAPEEWVEKTSGKILPCGRSCVKFKVQNST
jgi:hypothetical protein